MAATEQDAALSNTYLYSQLDSYGWNEDQVFQGGLEAILGSAQSPEQIEHLTLRAKCYYYARKFGTSVDFDGYKVWVKTDRTQSSSSLTNGGAQSTTFDPASEGPMSTSRLIAQGLPIDYATQESGGGGGMADAPKPATFQEICDLIAEGKPISGIKDIPDTVLEGQASETKFQRRRKPWERNTEAIEKASWMQ